MLFYKLFFTITSFYVINKKKLNINMEILQREISVIINIYIYIH